MAEFKLGRIRFIWKNNWAAAVTYVKDDIVRNGGKTYLCVIGHTADANFYTDLNNAPTRWNQVSDGSEWKDNWTTGFYYKVNDLVKYGGRIYLCNTAHTSNAAASSGTSPETTAGLEADQSKWDLYASSFNFRDNWATSQFYKIGDVVRYGGISYVCNTSHTSSSTASTDIDGLEADQGKWDTYAKGLDWIGNWTTGYRYKRNDVVLYGGTTYVCNTGHASAATATLGLENDQGLWDYFHKGITFLGTWSGSTVRYKVNDVVKYGADLWICTLDHTSAALFSDATNWSLFVGGLEYENSWSASEVYQPGDVVSYGGYAYISKTNHTNKIPTSNLSDWDLFTTGFSFQGDWATATDYKVGQVLRLNGYTYVALLDHTSSALNIPPDLTNWSRLNSGVKWAATGQTFAGVVGSNLIGSGTGASFNITLVNTRYTATVNAAGSGYITGNTVTILGTQVGGISPANDVILTITATAGAVDSATTLGSSVSWKTGVSYVLGDAVAFGVNSYICILAHTGGTPNRPDNDVTGTYWNLLSAGAITSVLTTQGDTLYMGGAGPTRLPIGTDGQVLRVNGTTPQWSYFGVVNNIVYVAPSGTDVLGAGQGLTIDKPWKTVRFSARQIEEGYLNPNAALLLTKNKQFIVKELSNYVTYTSRVTITSSNATLFTTSTSTSVLSVGMPISFTTTVGGVTPGTTYYVFDIPAGGTTFGITNASGGTRRTLSVETGANVGSYVFSTVPTERDAGIIVDALAFDISHSGTLQTTTAALAYFAPGGATFAAGNIPGEIPQFIRALDYLKNKLVVNILTNTSPVDNYQTLNSVSASAQAKQIIDPIIPAEIGTSTTATNLVSIITTGLASGTTSAIPAVINPGTTISVKTGTYSETLPIIVPKNTAVVGDELRSSVIQPATADMTLVTDKPKTISVLNRLKAIVPNLVTNTAVTPTSGNTASQVYLGYAGTTATSSVSANLITISDIVDNGLGVVPAFTLPDPTSYDTGYFNARRLIVANKAFLVSEVSAWINAQIAGNIAPFVGFTYGGVDQTSCERDVGYIVDAVVYDLTYGGNLETLVAGRSYYTFGAYVGDPASKLRALAVQARIKDIIDNIATGNTAGWTKTTGLTQDVSGTAGSANAAAFAQARIQDIYTTINTGTPPAELTPSITWVSTLLQMAAADVQARKASIQASAVAWVQSNYPLLVFNTETCSRDVGYIVDALTYDLMFGSNFRSVKAGMSYYTAQAALVVGAQKAAQLGMLAYMSDIVTDITTGIGSSGIGSSASVASILTNSAIMNDIVQNGLTAVPTFTFTNPTGYNTSFLAGYGDGKAQIVQNYAFIKDEVSSYLNTNFNAVWVALGVGGQANCQRDVGYILDALQYDMTYGGNTQTLIAGSAYYSNATLTIASIEKTATIAAYTWLKSFIDNIVIKDTAGWTKNSALSQVVTGTAGSAGAATFAQDRVQSIIDWITNGTAPATILPTAAIALASTPLQNAYNALQLAKTEIQSDAVSWVRKFYQALNFNSDTCYRDAGYIVDAFSYDLMFGTNFNSITAAMSYYRATTSAQYVLANQATAERGAINFIAHKAKKIAAYDTAEQVIVSIDDMILSIAGTTTFTSIATQTFVGGNITIPSTAGMMPGMPITFDTAGVGTLSTGRKYWIVAVTNSTTFTITETYGSVVLKTLTADSGNTSFTIGEVVETTGTGSYNNVVTSINGAEVLRANATFLSNEATAWVDYTYSNTIVSTDGTNNRAITGTNHNFVVGDPVVFSGTTFGNIVAGTVYYILTTPTTNAFTLTAVQGSATVFPLVTASASPDPFAVKYNFSITEYKKNTAAYINALVYDLALLGNYKALRAATIYKHSVSGSVLSDMFLLRNGTGLRNMTLSGLTGTLTAANSYGTSRVTAGAYSSLDPGYGPNDKNVWISPKSPYTQNVTMFGTGCIGMKIDGALHSAGNRSIVANDYTTILSDGIGVWCTGSQALTELVSVFAYYSYAGYLAELGGKMRATNGNNSYGTYGSLAEGVDTYEEPIIARVNNRYYQAEIGAVLTDSTDRIYRIEFVNAGTEYNSATFSISGTGYGVTTVANEFRDNAVFESRVLANGANYITQTNVAQGGTATSIVIAATDAGITGAYIGMRVIVTGGSGVGQTGYFTTYNNGTKAGIVAKESFTTLSISAAGSSLLTVADTTSLYANMPVILTGALLTGMSTIALGTIYYVIGSSITSTQFSVASSSGGVVAVAVGTSSSSSGLILNAVGWDHIITGTAIVSSLDLTSSYIIEPRITFTSPTYSATSRTSISSAWSDCVYGDTIVNYNGVANAGVTATGGSGSGATFTVARTGTAYVVTTNTAISGQGGTLYKIGDVLTIPGTSVGGVSTTNNITITVTLVATAPSSGISIGAILNFTYTGVGAGGYFVALAAGSAATQISSDGTTWATGGALTSNTLWNSIAYGNGRWVTVSNFDASSNYTTDPTALWTAGGTLGGGAGWQSICYGNGVFMAVKTGSTSASYSTNGTTWNATGALPASVNWTGVAYGAGTYVAIASGGTQAASSVDGLSWISRALPAIANWSSVTFGKGVFVAVATGSRITAYSKDGLTWIQSSAGMPVSQAWTKVRYGQGLFFAVATGSTTAAATSEDGANWTPRTLAGAAAAWPAIAFGNPSSVPLWVALTTSTVVANSIVAGCTTQARVKVSANSISEIRLIEPGSGYSTIPSLTITDPNQTSTATWSTRIGVGALANPTFTNRGLQFATAIATVEGNGYADKFQPGYYINVSGLTTSPTPGSNVVFAGDSTFYKLVAVNNYLGTGGGQSPYTARFQISPQFTQVTAPAHTTLTTMRIKYSQVRLTGHDFLSIGTGGTTTTNYPGIPTQPADVTKQTVGNGGGRVFYTSTDQDGNFTVGTLFSVQQATGVASINADAFNLAGLNSLTLGSVALGGTGATITSFSTDQYFSANSDNIVPTQKAIKAYISSQIGGGSSALNVNTLTAGVIYIAGNSISTTTGVQINVTATMNFTGGINGLPLAMDFLLLG